MYLVVKTSQILPSQDFLKPETVKYIFDCIKNNTPQLLPPTPIVRRTDDAYVALDGHNLIAVMDYLGKDIEVFVAASANDTLPGNDEATTVRNKELADKFDSLFDALKITQSSGIYSFIDLINKYKNLFEGMEQ